jgi:hypothetical protein
MELALEKQFIGLASLAIHGCIFGHEEGRATYHKIKNE